MKNRTLLSLPFVPESVGGNRDYDKIAEYLGISLKQEKEPKIHFVKDGIIYLLCGIRWEDEEERSFFTYEVEMPSLRFENPTQEIEELKNLNQSLQDKCDKLEKERDIAIQKQEESVSKDLLLQAISAATGQELKRNK